MAVANRRPPVRKVRVARGKSPGISTNPVTYGFLAVCLVIHVAWLLMARTPSGLAFMQDNFVVSWDAVRSGHVWTLISAGLSHYEVMHFLVNALAIYSFGVPLERALGSGRLAAMLLLAILAGDVAHLAFMLAMNSPAGALGASGGAMALGGAFAMRWPQQRIILFFLFPVPAAVAVALFVVLDLFGLFATSSSPIAHAAHLGGLAVGLGLAWIWRKI